MAEAAVESRGMTQQGGEPITGRDVFQAVFTFGAHAETEPTILSTRDERALLAGAAWLRQVPEYALLGETLQALSDQRTKDGIRMDDIHRLRELFLHEVDWAKLDSTDPEDVL